MLGNTYIREADEESHTVEKSPPDDETTIAPSGGEVLPWLNAVANKREIEVSCNFMMNMFNIRQESSLSRKKVTCQILFSESDAACDTLAYMYSVDISENEMPYGLHYSRCKKNSAALTVPR